jgi:PadR family transcriptional regulator
MTKTSGRPVLAEFELLVMLAVARLGEGAYGAEVRREIEDRADRPVSIGAVYATLGRLGEKRYVTYRASEPLPVKGGRSRKVYSLTERGREVLRQSTGALANMMEGVSLFPSRGAGKS